ncbi:MAG: hypothetical protein AAGB25_01760 [Pseudomonadota bacterium]
MTLNLASFAPHHANARTDGPIEPAWFKRGMHEFVSAEYGDQAACTGLVLALLHSLHLAPCLWVSLRLAQMEHGALSARGLIPFGLDPGGLVHVCASKPIDVLWAAEEALKSGTVGAVAAEIGEADFTATRRLSLAAASLGIPLLLLAPHGREGATAAQTRWRISHAPSAVNRFDPFAPGNPRWRAVLERSRTAPAEAGRHFNLEFDHETLRLLMADQLAARPAQTHAPGPAKPTNLRRAG